MRGEKNDAQHTDNQNNRDKKQDTAPDAAHDLLLTAAPSIKTTRHQI